MKVFLVEDGQHRLAGRTDLSHDVGPVHEEHLLGASGMITVSYTIGTVSHYDQQGRLVVERCVLLSPLQDPTLLPGWTPAAS